MVSTRTLGVALVAATTVSAHGFVKAIIADGVEYGGYLVNQYPYKKNPPTVVAWSEQEKELGFIAPDKYTSPDIICHLDAENAGGHATVKAGAEIFLEWDRWPKAHFGPILDYLASCGDANCEDINKEDLKFFKIDEAGLQDGTTEWYTKTLLKNMGWLIKIPENLKPGNYVLRHELIALHSAQNKNGAQNYPQCFNLKVEGSGTELPEGVSATELYKPDDAGILVSIYGSKFKSYSIPGPEVASIGGSVEQSVPAATTTASATVPGNAAATAAPKRGSKTLRYAERRG